MSIRKRVWYLRDGQHAYSGRFGVGAQALRDWDDYTRARVEDDRTGR